MTPTEPRGGEPNWQEMKRLASQIVNELTPDQGHQATSAFGLAARLQGMISAAAIEEGALSPPVVHGWPEREDIEVLKSLATQQACLTGRDRAAIDRVLSLFPPVVGWRGIDTAPKDGTPILISRPTVFMVEEGCHVVRWDEHPYSDGNAWVCHDGKQDTPLRGPDPTHWQPLPAAPLTDGVGE